MSNYSVFDLNVMHAFGVYPDNVRYVMEREYLRFAQKDRFKAEEMAYAIGDVIGFLRHIPVPEIYKECSHLVPEFGDLNATWDEVLEFIKERCVRMYFPKN